MKILRIGGIGRTTSRFLDLLERTDLEQLVILPNKGEEHWLQDLYDTANFFHLEHLLTKLKIGPCIKIANGMWSKVLRKIGKEICSTYLIGLANIPIIKQLKKYYKYFDAIWLGDNDFDGSNYLFCIIARDFLDQIPIIRSYKETRFIKRWEEYITLKQADYLIFPSRAYLEFFKDLYRIVLNNVSFADLDWQYSRTIQWVKSITVKKLSAQDGRPHVCILTGRALSDVSERRSGYRYYFVPVVKELVKRGIAVHLHAMNIIASQSGKNPYAEIAHSSNSFHIERPLRLTAGSDDYRILKRYDAGILHPPVPQDNVELYRFQQINIPNRIYEYQMADVVPLVEANSAAEVERFIAETSFGIVFTDYDDLCEKLYELINSREQNLLSLEKIKSYKDFGATLIQAIKTAK